MTNRFEHNNVDLLLIVAETEWDSEGLNDPASYIYEILADGTSEPINLAACGADRAVRFTLKHTDLVTVATRVSIGMVDAALITSALLEALQPSLVAQVGFGGIISDDLRLGDVAVASQVDCYLTKNKAAPSYKSEEGGTSTEIAFAGEVFRPSHSLVQFAINLKHAHPDIYAEYQEEVRQSLKGLNLLRDEETRTHLRSADVEEAGGDVSLVHAVHFACAEIVSTTSGAVKWLRSRDRKLAVVDMESGGVLAAAWEYYHRRGQPIETLVIRGAGGYGDERHDGLIKRNSRQIRQLAFHNACRFLCRLMSARLASVRLDSDNCHVDVGILFPLEEEFSYFIDSLRDFSAGASIRAVYRQGRYYYLFRLGRLTCAATFVGDMGLVRMALATADMYRAWAPSTLVVLGIAAGLSGPDGDLKICDVAVAKFVDLYFHRAHNRMGANDRQEDDGRVLTIVRLREEPPIILSPDLVSFATADERFDDARTQWVETCAQEVTTMLEPFLKSGEFNPDELSVSRSPKVLAVSLASGEFLAGASEFVNALAGRGCGAVDMEAGGAAVAYQGLLNQLAARSAPKLLVIRGISDRGDEKKSAVEAACEPNMFRRACMRNASRLLIMLLENADFANLVTEPDISAESRANRT